MRNKKGQFIKGHKLGFQKEYTPYNKGKKCPEISLSLQGNIPWNKGKKGIYSEETILKMSLIKKGKSLLQFKGENNRLWKGDEVGYGSLHKWVKSMLGKPSFCTINSLHNAKRYVWANISGEYERDISDWHSLCQSCNKLDGIKIHSRFRQGGIGL